MALLRNASALLGLAALVGCGGSGSIDNASKVRFFDAFRGTSNVRLYVGGRLYKAGNDSSFELGDGFEYADAPSGTGLTITVNPYNDTNSTIATLASQTLNEGDHYTLVGVTTGTSTSGSTTTYTQSLRRFPDSLTQLDDTQYLRVLQASSTTTPVYLRLYRKSDNALAYSSSASAGLAVGNSSGYLPITPTITSDSEDYTLIVYGDALFQDELGSGTVTLRVGNPATAIVYNRASSGTDLRIKSGPDSVD